MAKPYSELRAKMSPEHREKAAKRTEKMLKLTYRTKTDLLEEGPDPFIPGSVISGTMRPQDLIPAFLDELEMLNCDVFEAMASDRAYIASQEADEDSEWWDSEEAGFFLDELFNKLNAEAPEGYFFGAHPGDGADYGFWRNASKEAE